MALLHSPAYPQLAARLRTFWFMCAGAHGPLWALLSAAGLAAMFALMGFGALICLFGLAVLIGLADAAPPGWRGFLAAYGPGLVGVALAAVLAFRAARPWPMRLRLSGTLAAAGLGLALFEGIWFLLDVVQEDGYRGLAGIAWFALLLLADLFIVVSLLWTTRRIFGPSSGDRSWVRRSWRGALLGAVGASSIAIIQGAALPEFLARDWFYGLLIPAFVGMAWSDRRATRPSHLLALCLIGSAGVIAASAIPIPFTKRHDLDCQPWVAEHLVLGVGGLPFLGWDWRELPVGVVAAPVIIPETTLLTILAPLDARC